MSTHRDDDPYRAHDAPLPPEERPVVSYGGQLLRGTAAAIACDTLFNVPWTVASQLLRPENVLNAIGSLLLGVNMLVGYIGGRVSAAAGLAHDDGRAQWTMAASVSLLSYVVQIGVYRAQWALRLPHAPATATPPASAPGVFLVFFVGTLLLTRFGFAMGTYSQARREGRVDEDEDEAGAE